MEENLLPALQSIPDVRIVALSSRSIDNAAARAAAHGIGAFTDDWREMLDPSLLDAVVVAAPPAVHAEVARAALSRGVSVFVEKPPAPDRAELQALCEAEEAARNCIAFVDYNFRYSDGFVELARTMAQWGELRCLKLRFLTSKPKAPLWNLRSVEESYLQAIAIHPFETAVHLLGSPCEVYAAATHLGPDTFCLQVVLRFAGDRTCTLELGNYACRFDCRYEWLTDGGMVGVLSDLQTLTLSTSQAGSRSEHRILSPLQGGYGRGGYKGALEAFRDSARKAFPSPSPLRSSLPVYTILEEVGRAIKT